MNRFYCHTSTTIVLWIQLLMLAVAPQETCNPELWNETKRHKINLYSSIHSYLDSILHVLGQQYWLSHSLLQHTQLSSQYRTSTVCYKKNILWKSFKIPKERLGNFCNRGIHLCCCGNELCFSLTAELTRQEMNLNLKIQTNKYEHTKKTILNTKNG